MPFTQSGRSIYGLSHASSLVYSFFRFDLQAIKNIIPISVSGGLLTLAVPLGVQILVNRILSTALPGQALTIVTMVSLGLVFAATLRITQRILVEKIQRRFHTRIVLAAANNVLQKKNEKASSLYYDTFIVQKAVSSLLTEGLAVFMQLLFALCLLAFYHPFFLAFDFVLLLGIYFVVFVPMPHLLETAADESQAKHETSRFLFELPQSTQTEPFLEKADLVATEYLNRRESHFRLIFSQMIGLSGVHILGNAILLGVGSYLVIKEQMSLGQLVAAELVFSSAFMAVEKLNKHLESFYDLSAALAKLKYIMVDQEGLSHE
jgi:putative ABC transport system ATP-binding protein